MSRDTRRQRRCVPIQRIFESIQVTDTRRQTRVNGPYYIQEQPKIRFSLFPQFVVVDWSDARRYPSRANAILVGRTLDDKVGRTLQTARKIGRTLDVTLGRTQSM